MPHPDASVNRKRWLLLRFEASTFHPEWFVVEENEMVLTTFNLDDNMNFGKNPKAWANPTLIEKKEVKGVSLTRNRNNYIRHKV